MLVVGVDHCFGGVLVDPQLDPGPTESQLRDCRLQIQGCGNDDRRTGCRPFKCSNVGFRSGFLVDLLLGGHIGLHLPVRSRA